jgi:hypothetical protein
MRQIVNDRTPQHIIPTVRVGVPIPKTGKGRPARPLNPVLLAMQTGQSFVITGADARREMMNDIAAVRKAHEHCKFVTRNLSNKVDTETFETYPEHTLGVWCMVPVTQPIQLAPAMAPVVERAIAKGWDDDGGRPINPDVLAAATNAA